MKIEDIPKGSRNRLLRIQELRGGDLTQALEYCISVGWLYAEKAEIRKAGFRNAKISDSHRSGSSS